MPNIEPRPPIFPSEWIGPIEDDEDDKYVHEIDPIEDDDDEDDEYVSDPQGELDLQLCRFCGSEAIAIYWLDEGCVCYPNDKVQALCEQHIYKSTPLRNMKCIFSDF